MRVVCCLSACSLVGFAQAKRPFTFEDMMQLKRIGEPRFRPMANGWRSAPSMSTLRQTRRRRICGSSRIAGGDAQAPDAGNRFGRRSHSLLARRQTRAVRVGERRQFADLRAGLRHRHRNPDRRADAKSRDLDRSFRRRHGRRTAKSILFVSSVWPDCKDDACNKQQRRRESQVEGEGQDLHQAHVPPLDQLLRRQVQPPVPGVGRWRSGARSYSRRARRSAVLSWRTGPVRVLARRQRDRLHQQHRRGTRRQARTATSSSCQLPAERRRRSPPIREATRRRCIRPTESTSPIARSFAEDTRATASA